MKKLKGKKKKGVLVRIFALSMFISLGVCIIVIAATAAAYNALIHDKGIQTSAEVEVVEIEEDKLVEDKEVNQVVELDERMNKTIAIFGTDLEGSRTDVILVVNFNSETGKAHVISVPRDTKVEWKSDQRQLLPKRNSWVSVSKINEMTAWGGIDQVRGLTVKELENILGIKIDNYVIVSLSAFREIIDSLGGVEFDVPQRMKKDDYSQNLHIDLYPGVQVLDGNQSEQLVRFRDYTNGDLGRIKVQQEFLNMVAKKILSIEMITKLPKVIPVLFKSVKTDIELLEIPSFYPYIKNFDVSKLYFHTLPGKDKYENKISYYIADLDATEVLISELFFDNMK